MNLCTLFKLCPPPKKKLNDDKYFTFFGWESVMFFFSIARLRLGLQEVYGMSMELNSE